MARKCVRPMLERLEDRNLLSTTYSVSGLPSQLVPALQQVHAADVTVTSPGQETATELDVKVGSSQAASAVSEVIVLNNHAVAGTGTFDPQTDIAKIPLSVALNPGATSLLVYENTSTPQNPSWVNIGLEVTDLQVVDSGNQAVPVSASGSAKGNSEYVVRSLLTFQSLPLPAPSGPVQDGSRVVIARFLAQADPAGPMDFKQFILNSVSISGGTMDGFTLKRDGVDITNLVNIKYIPNTQQMVVSFNQADVIPAGGSHEYELTALMHGSFSGSTSAQVTVTTALAAPDDNFSAADLGLFTPYQQSPGVWLLASDSSGAGATVADIIVGDGSGSFSNSDLQPGLPLPPQTVTVTVVQPPTPEPVNYGSPPDLGLRPPDLGSSRLRELVHYFWAAEREFFTAEAEAGIGDFPDAFAEWGQFLQDWNMFLAI